MTYWKSSGNRMQIHSGPNHVGNHQRRTSSYRFLQRSAFCRAGWQQTPIHSVVGCLLFCLLIFPALIFPAQSSAAQDDVDFNRDVKPLLSSRCFLCHGPDETSRESGLRLDTADGATEDLGGYQAIVPGDLEASELIRRIASDDESEVMPPPEHGEPLSDKEKEIFKRWVAAGGNYAKHWSYVAPQRPVVPQVEPSDWPKNEIDHFILNRMKPQGLQPSPMADRYVLARRVSLDLTGLPPSLDSVEQFVRDDSPNAYEKFVDQLLASPAYGEHWAAMWLDLARYADSAGYADDRKRTIWAYRDYVIRAFESNMPFDQFTIEQIAGDMLPDATEQTRIATAFHRNTLTNSEGGTSDEEFRSAAVVDRTNTTMAVWMGTTMACAQCHTHKYDPISQQEYFQVYAFLNNTADNDRPDEKPVLGIFLPEQLKQQKEIEAKIAALRQELQEISSGNPADIESRLAKQQSKWEQLIRAQSGNLKSGRFVKVELVDRAGILSLAEVQVFSSGTNIAAGKPTKQSSTDFAGPAEYAVDGNTSGNFDHKTVTHTANEKNPWWQVDLGDNVTIDSISIWNRTGPGLQARLDGYRVSILDEQQKPVWTKEFAKAPKTEQQISPNSIPGFVAQIIQTPVDQRSDEQAKQIRKYFVENASQSHRLKLEIASQEKKLASLKPATTVPVMQELAPAKHRQTRVQIRGSYANLGDPVEAATPAAFHPLEGPTRDRLALARWLVNRNNPLTARVAVNRYWQKLFGTGLVATSEDFGSQGELPTHPNLLDYLAVEYMDSGWDNRALLKRLVMSATYQQSSRVTPEKLENDPDNRWLSRGPRVRVSAEMVRDQALFASGLLSSKRYGPPVKPPGPELGLRAAFSGNIAWVTSKGEDRYRRAIYTEWRRSSPYPSMETFDVSNREVCDLRRISTNTPLQALVTLNDEVFVEASQALAQRMMADSSDPRAIAEQGFRLVLIRKPRPNELDELVRLYNETKTHFEAHPDDAKTFATEPLQPPKPGTDFVELASWTTVANVLLNLDEVFLKP